VEDVENGREMEEIIVCPLCFRNDLLISLNFLGQENAGGTISFRKGRQPLYEDIPKWLRRLAKDIFVSDFRPLHAERVKNYLQIPKAPKLKKPIGLYEFSISIALVSLLLGILFEENARAAFFVVFVVSMVGALIALVFHNPSGEELYLVETEVYESEIEEYRAKLAILKRTYFCFRDDICFDPIGGFSWKTSDTAAVFKDLSTEKINFP
jgi:hypothetical protein